MKGSKRVFLIFAALLAAIILSALWLLKPFGAPGEASVELTSLEPASPKLPNNPAVICYSFDAPHDTIMYLDILRYENGGWQLAGRRGTSIGSKRRTDGQHSGDIRLLVYPDSTMEAQITCGGTAIYRVDAADGSVPQEFSVKAPDSGLTSPLENELPVTLICFGGESAGTVQPELSDFRSYEDYGRFSCVYALVLTFTADGSDAPYSGA